MGFTECVQVDRAGNAAAELRRRVYVVRAYSGKINLTPV
jgi:hypothetical protein